MLSMATHTAALSTSYIHSCKRKQLSSPAINSSHALNDPRPSYNPLVFQAVRLLGPPARFEASKLKVLFMGEQFREQTRTVPRTYILSHCDFTANLTLTISSIIPRNQLKGWYNKDDVVAEWTEVNGDLCLNVHCYVSGPNSISDLTAEFRYHIFSKELPLVLEAVLHGDADLFRERQDLMEAIVRVFFHSSSNKYNHVECWGPLKDAAAVGKVEKSDGFLPANKESEASSSSGVQKLWGSPKSIFQALFTFLL